MVYIADVSAGNVITSAWGNGIRDQAITTVASWAGLSAIVPVEGQHAYVQDVDVLAYYNGTTWVPTPGTIIARGSRASSSATTTSVVGVMRLPVGAVAAGVAYRVSTCPLLLTMVSGDTTEAHVRYTTDGSTPTTASDQLPSAFGIYQMGTAYETVTIDTVYVPEDDEDLTLLLCVRRTGGAGNVGIYGSLSNPMKMWVSTMGKDPGDTGEDV